MKNQNLSADIWLLRDGTAEKVKSKKGCTVKVGPVKGDKDQYFIVQLIETGPSRQTRNSTNIKVSIIKNGKYGGTIIVKDVENTFEEHFKTTGYNEAWDFIIEQRDILAKIALRGSSIDYGIYESIDKMLDTIEEMSTCGAVAGYTVPLGMKAPSQEKLRNRWNKNNKKGMNIYSDVSVDEEDGYTGEELMVRRRFAPNYKKKNK